MDLHSLSNTSGARKRRTRVGRGNGSGHGKTCGKGHKGQMARKGHKRKPGFEGGQMRLVRRLPKRGFNNPYGSALLPVNVGELDRFDDGAEVTWAILKSEGLARGRGDGVKILGTGELEKKLTVKAQGFSKGARAKIESAGGVCEVVAD
ncbi:50S ribosomal protein L15 [Verrucomicrobiota bacterium]